MKRQKYYLYSDNIKLFKKKLFQWAQQFEMVSYLDSNNYEFDRYSSYDCLLAVEAVSVLKTSSGNAFEQLDDFWESKKDWLFGFLSYDLKNETAGLTSQNKDGIGLPDLCFFQPRIVVLIKGSKVVFELIDDVNVLVVVEQILNQKLEGEGSSCRLPKLKSRINQKEYLAAINSIRQEIEDGEVYEMNFCQEFYAKNEKINPHDVFVKLNDFSQSPFSAFCKFEEVSLMCASPERFLKKQGKKLISQPIKGTIRKSENDSENEVLKEQLRNDPKEQAENVMIVDLVRNDLMRSCQTGSVEVEELFGVYAFKSVNHLISTVVGKMNDDIAFTEIISNAFPMGSMTGCPKIRAMELIEMHESCKRGLYSGALGYIDPNQNFDFNVVIRSLIYNEQKKYLSLQIGGAITYDSIAEKEYEECILKAESVLKCMN